MTPPPPISATPEHSLWYYADPSNQPQGPITFAEIQRLAEEGIIGADTPIIREGGAEWQAYSTLLNAADPIGAPDSECPSAQVQQIALSHFFSIAGIKERLMTWSRNPIWIILIVVAVLFKIGAHMVVRSGDAQTTSPKTISQNAEEKSHSKSEVTTTSGVPPLLKAPPSRVGKSERASRIETLPITPSTLKRRLTDALDGTPYTVRNFSITTEGEKDHFKAKVSLFELEGGIDKASGKLTDVTVIASVTSADYAISFMSTVIECITPSQFTGNELVDLMRSMIKKASVVPGDVMTTTIESNERGFRINALLDPESRKVAFTIEPAEIYFHLR